jgi:limonene-1,2-epoxide hydrolase
MSPENVEVAREAVDAFNRRDLDAFVARVRPDAEWDDTDGFPGVRGGATARILRRERVLGDLSRDWAGQCDEFLLRRASTEEER